MSDLDDALNSDTSSSTLSKLNFFQAVLGAMAVVFPSTYLWTKLFDKIAEYLNDFLLSADGFVDILQKVNYFIPLDFILLLVFLYYSLMMILLVIKWTLKIIPFIG